MRRNRHTHLEQKINLWIFDAWTDFFLKFLCQAGVCENTFYPEVAVFFGQFYLEAHFFLIKPSGRSMTNPVFPNKSWVT